MHPVTLIKLRLFLRNIMLKYQGNYCKIIKQFLKIILIINSRTKKRYHALKFHNSLVDLASWTKVTFYNLKKLKLFIKK